MWVDFFFFGGGGEEYILTTKTKEKYVWFIIWFISWIFSLSNQTTKKINKHKGISFFH